MADPFEASISRAKETCLLLNDILSNCVDEKVQPTQETINGISVALDALRSAEGKLLDRISKDIGRDAQAVREIYS